MYALFQEFDFLNISKVAKYAGIHAGLLRQYSSGVKHPSLNQAKKIEDTIHRLADEMKKATIYAE
jgi:predicted transcriptional regulator